MSRSDWGKFTVVGVVVLVSSSSSSSSVSKMLSKFRSLGRC